MVYTFYIPLCAFQTLYGQIPIKVAARAADTNRDSNSGMNLKSMPYMLNTMVGNAESRPSRPVA